ncbi:LytR C-terminal domain-containing protein [Massilia sp. PWRC2]|uniref:LytR C-terminal domain-containing protein n=1 Tax=Massilia sp. PWRC2 TaxID=2804626 RepID=UPI003CEFE6D7
MHLTVKTLAAACTSTLLFACADLGHVGKAPFISADDVYLLARQQHLAARLPAAFDSYQLALRADPRHLNATNGMATLYAEQGQLAKAIGMWHALSMSAADSAATAFIHGNLGYAYLLNGDYQLAVASLERACALDPFSARAWRHLGNALSKLGQDERADRMLRQAQMLEQHDLRRDYLLTAATPLAAVTDIDGALAMASAAIMPTASTAPATHRHDGVALPASEVRQTGQATFELQRPQFAAASPRARPVATRSEDEVAAPPPVRVEIRNGNGVTGMARALSASIADEHTRVVRLTNQTGFRVAQTRVEFRRGFSSAASHLADQFGGEAVQAVPGANVDLRLVLGRDLARTQSEARRVIRAALDRTARAG